MRQVKGTVNAVELLGRLGGDPDLRTTPNGAQVCKFNVATKRPAGRDSEGKRGYETDWITVESWDRLAEQCADYLRKGSRVRVSGSLRVDNWTDKETGQPRSRTYVRAEDVLFLDGRPEPREAEAQPEEETADIPF